jgi:integrase
MAFDLSKSVSREKLTPRTEPYWQSIESGASLGFRKKSADSVGSWLLRWRDETGLKKYEQRPLGDFAGLTPGDRYKAAMRSAREVLGHVEAGGANQAVTVRGACASYVGHLRAKGEAANASDTESRFERHVNSAAVADVELTKLRRHHLDAWRNALHAKPVEINPHAGKRGGTVATRPRSASATNRDMTSLRAALNHAKEHGHVLTDVAWVAALKPMPGASNRREVYLTKDQRRRLLASASGGFGPFMMAMCAMPLRPGAVAGLTVSDFDKRTATLHVRTDKAHAGRRIPINGTALALVTEACRGKLPGAPMFGRLDGKHWTKETWRDAMNAAAEAAGDMPQGVCAYSLRHSTITDLATAGVPLLTVAQFAGADARTLEKTYAHLLPQSADHLAVLAL